MSANGRYGRESDGPVRISSFAKRLLRRPRPAVDAALKELGPGSITVVDVGARWGANEAWYRLKPLVNLIGFEPDVEECARLNQGADTHEKFYPLALGSHAGAATLYVTVNPASSSLYKPSQQILERFPDLAANLAVVSEQPVRLTLMA